MTTATEKQIAYIKQIINSKREMNLNHEGEVDPQSSAYQMLGDKYPQRKYAAFAAFWDYVEKYLPVLSVNEASELIEALKAILFEDNLNDIMRQAKQIFRRGLLIIPQINALVEQYWVLTNSNRSSKEISVALWTIIKDDLYPPATTPEPATETEDRPQAKQINVYDLWCVCWYQPADTSAFVEATMHIEPHKGAKVWLRPAINVEALKFFGEYLFGTFDYVTPSYIVLSPEDAEDTPLTDAVAVYGVVAQDEQGFYYTLPQLSLQREYSRGAAYNWLTPEQAAERTNTNPSTWRNNAAKGKIIGAVKKGKQWLIPDDYVRGYRDARRKTD